MASGRTHAVVSALAGVGLGMILSSPDAFLGAVSGILLSPDLDHPKGYIGLRFIRALPLVGKPLSVAWHYYWSPYRFLVGLFNPKRPGASDSHRSWLSHLPLVGTFFRLLYLLLPAWVLSGDFFIPSFHFCLGLVVSDVLHSVFDSVQW